MNHVLVTGATGFLGHHLVERLAALDVPAIAIGRDAAKCAALAEAGFRVIRQDLADPLDETVHPELRWVETIVHCAALSAPFGRLSDFTRANVTATQNLVDFAKRQGVRRFVQISSPSLYFAYRDDLDAAESAMLPPPVNAYAATKRQAERIVLAAPQIGPVVLRPRGIYGVGDRTLLPRLLRVARLRPLPLFRKGAARIDLTHVNDVIDAILATLSAGNGIDGEIFNVSGGEVVSITQIVERACLRTGTSVRWRPMPLGPAMLAARILEKVALGWPGAPEPAVTPYALGLFAFAQSLDITKAGQMLKWSPTISFEEGLERTFAGVPRR